MNKPRVSILSVLLHLLPAFLLCGLFAAVGIIHVSSRVLVVRVGYQLSALQLESRTLARENDRLKLELATLKSPARLERVAREELGMAPPTAAQVIPLRASPERQARAEGKVQRLGRRGAP
ncbi:MAG: cell division protein FtsL [Myxococcaceae bacterium]|nr:cell division protein FtsL [Myxococcaceae bacterium]